MPEQYPQPPEEQVIRQTLAAAASVPPTPTQETQQHLMIPGHPGTPPASGLIAERTQQPFNLPEASREAWSSTALLLKKLSEGGVNPEVRLLRSGAIARFAGSTGLGTFRRNGDWLGTRKTRDSFAGRKQIGGWELPIKFGKKNNFDVRLGEDGQLYFGERMSQRDRERGIIIAAGVREFGQELSSESEYRKVMGGLARLAERYGIDWPPRDPEDGGGRPAPVSPMMGPGGSERSGAAPRSTSPRAPRQSHDPNQTTPNISDLIEVDKYGRAHRGIKRSDVQKGDGRYLSNYEIEMIRANRDLIREDLPSRMIQSRLAGAIAVALASEAERRPAEVPEPEKQGDRPAKKQRGSRVGARVLPLAVKIQQHQGKRPNQASHRKAA